MQDKNKIIIGHKIVGNGKKNIIFLHELLGDHTNYESIIKYIDTKKYKLIFVDLRGYTLSKQIKGDYTLQETSNDIKNLITHLRLENTFILAHSMSTIIAQKIALEDNRILKILLVTPIPPCGLTMNENSKQSLLKQMKEDEKNIENIIKSASKRYNQTWIKKRLQLANNCSNTQTKIEYMKIYLNNDFSNEAKNSNIPIDIIVGKYDFNIFKKEYVQKNFEQFYNKLHIIEFQECGHYPMIETPIIFASKIEECFK